MTSKLGKTYRGYSKNIQLGPGSQQLGVSSLLKDLVNWSELEVLAFATLCKSLYELEPLMILFGLPRGNKIID